MNLKINKLQHIGIPVTNLVRSETFYATLGFKNITASQFDYAGEKGVVSMMQLNDIMIELYQMPEAALLEIRNRRDGHIDHIAFDVDDIDHTYSILKNASFQIIEKEPVYLPFWKNGCKYFNILGPDDERLEFNQIIDSQ